jgi:hypothetical protein
MKTPRYTDLARYPNGWKKAVDTNVAETFEKVRKQLAQTQTKVQPIRRTK